MTVVDFLCFLFYVTKCSETISRKYNDIIFSQYSRIPIKPPLEHHMPHSFHENRLTKCDHLSRETELSRIETSFTKKSGDKIRIERFCHEGDESFTASSIEESIMDDSDFWILFHLPKDNHFFSKVKREKLTK